MTLSLDVGGRNTIAAWLRQGTTGQQLPSISPDNIAAVRDEADRVLGYYGLNIIRPRNGGRPEHFAIANRHQGLERLHTGTHWAGRSGAIVMATMTCSRSNRDRMHVDIVC